MLEQIAVTLSNSDKVDGNFGFRDQPKRTPIQLDGQFRELDLDFDANTGVFWCRFQFSNRPSFTPEVLSELRRMRQLLTSRTNAAGTQAPQVKYMVLASRMQGVFNLGGDLHLFADLIRRRDRAALTAYARACVAEVHANLQRTAGEGAPASVSRPPTTPPTDQERDVMLAARLDRLKQNESLLALLLGQEGDGKSGGFGGAYGPGPGAV